MLKNIKITERQYKMLMEADENVFPYVTDSDFKPFDGYYISADGNIDGETPAEANTTADMIAVMRTMDGWNRYRTYGNIYPTSVREGVEITNKEDNTADDTGEVDAFDSDKLEDPNIVQIPNMIQKRMQQFFDELEKYDLNPAQESVILNQVTPHLTSDSTTPHEQKKFSQKVQEKPHIHQDAKNIANTD